MACPFKAFKDVFGAAGTGVHRHRFGNVAIVDYVLSLVLAALVSLACNVPLTVTTIGVLALSILAHSLFCVDTATGKYLSP